MSRIKKVLVAGGVGYIGTHCCVELLMSGYNVVCADNFNNSTPEAISRVEYITKSKIETRKVDFCNREQVDELFDDHFDAAIHLAGHKSVYESISQPLMYYKNNILSVINLCEGVRRSKCNKIIFSSSAVVYDDLAPIPYTEASPRSSSNPYGRTKIMNEDILQDFSVSNPDLAISILRYFNPVGAHPSGLIGEDPRGVPTNLMPFISQVAVGKLNKLEIFGDDYDTPDGTCVRDFIHVVDLARGHLAALQALERRKGCIVHNLGTGEGHSVLELIRSFEKTNNVEVPYVIAPRREGDMPINYASVVKAENELCWKAKLNLEDMVRDSWNWQSKNPNGYVE